MHLVVRDGGAATSSFVDLLGPNIGAEEPKFGHASKHIWRTPIDVVFHQEKDGANENCGRLLRASF